MVRVHVPGGRLIPAQTSGLATIAAHYGENWIHLSTRQNVELHHVDAHDVNMVLRGTEALGLTNRSACGHTLRNVMSCPDAGYGLDEPFDCFPDALAVSDAIVARSAELNTQLPSRINMADPRRAPTPGSTTSHSSQSSSTIGPPTTCGWREPRDVAVSGHSPPRRHRRERRPGRGERTRRIVRDTRRLRDAQEKRRA